MDINVVFFGSTSDSVIVLDKLYTLTPTPYTLSAVVTQPPKPVGREQVLTPTPVEIWTKEHTVPVLSFPTKPDKPWEYENEETVIDTLQTLKADLLVSASYGQKIPAATIQDAKFGGLNVHPSLLPRWRGADPVPWAILSGDHQAGVSVVTLAPTFDQGAIIAQKKVPITPEDTSDPFRTRLFTLGADLLIQSLPDYLTGKNKGIPQQIVDEPYAKRFSRDDGFEPWDTLKKAFHNTEDATRIGRKFRALNPWPGVWTKVAERRLKLLEVTLKDGNLLPITVQLEGKKPVSWEQFKSAYVPQE